ncbi:5'-nucleotidase [Synechococcus sp. PCC 6312]|uniref:5'-nucleotidase n=1 Tax=Synechococcus sp. (strain ATCC 27167 / PCC 6312) TaxID=195253 RepID=UPI00029EEFE4|nr:5'-nucleotidase [Synechococcus sp. PCC 6312]AFY61463.1 5'-nucleotidase [Synechococcus sp. PCC 6312]
MTASLAEKLVIGVASSALFDLTESHQIFIEKGAAAYRHFQREKSWEPLPLGVAFPFVRRFLGINQAYPDQQPVEVILLSKNDPDTGQRVFNSIKHYGLGITRAGFLNGKSPHPYIPAFNIALFLSANEQDVRQAIHAGHPAGIVLPSQVHDEETDSELRIAFDFDGVLADDEAEAVYYAGNLDSFQAHEIEKAHVPHNPGPLSNLFKKLAAFQRLESERAEVTSQYTRILRTAIITARNSPASDRVVTTLNAWGVRPDETFFLGGLEKRSILEVMKPHIFFDDQMTHLSSVAQNIPSVHVPFGIRNVARAEV